MKRFRRLAALFTRRPRVEVVHMHVAGTVVSDRALANAIQRELMRRPPHWRI